MTTMQSVTLTCPNCSCEVWTQVLTSTNFHGLTSDLRQLTTGMSPWGFMIHSCQDCGFTGDSSSFEGTVSSDVSDQIRNLIYPHIHDEQIDTDMKWEFAAQIAEWRKQSPETIANLYLNAAWCALKSEKECYYRRRAADWFEQALDYDVEGRLTITYLIGELYRRVGDTDVAHYWFDLAISEASKNPDASFIKKIATQQKTNPQEMIQH